MHGLVRKAEVVADLVDRDVRDEVLELLSTVRPFVENGAAEQPDAVGLSRGIADAPLVQWHALVEAAQLERIVDAERGERLVVSQFLDHEHDIAELRGKASRQT